MANWRSLRRAVDSQRHSRSHQDHARKTNWVRLLASNIPGTFPRFNGSPYYTTKIARPDRRRRTQIHGRHCDSSPARSRRHRPLLGPFVTCCDSADFGPHRMLTDRQRVADRPLLRRPALRARAIHRLHRASERIRTAATPAPPPGRKSSSAKAAPPATRRPLYTNNKLTLAQGYRTAQGPSLRRRHHAHLRRYRPQSRA